MTNQLCYILVQICNASILSKIICNYTSLGSIQIFRKFIAFRIPKYSYLWIRYTYFLTQEFGDKLRVAQKGQKFYKVAFKTPKKTFKIKTLDFQIPKYKGVILKVIFINLIWWNCAYKYVLPNKRICRS